MLRLPDATELSSRLSQLYGARLSVRCEPTSSGAVVQVVPVDLHPNEGFTVETMLGWRTVEARFHPGRYAAELIGDLSRAAPEERRAASAFLVALEREGGKLSFRINGINTSASDPAAWPAPPWTMVELAVRRSALVLEDLSDSALADAIVRWAGGILGAVIALAHVEELPEADDRGLPEGARKTVVVNRYERSRVNRAACIAALGPACRACGFQFGDVYGSGAEGFIHVHHVRPVSEIGPGYVVDPVRDLVPVCPNCHAYMHLRNPPYSVAEVRGALGYTSDRPPPSETIGDDSER